MSTSSIPERCRGLVHDSCIKSRKRILYFNPDPGQLDRFFQALERSPDCEIGPGCIHPRVTCQRTGACWVAEDQVDGVMRRIRELYISLVLIDVRRRQGQDREAVLGQAWRLLQAMDDVEDIERRYGFHRILVLISGSDDETDRLILDLGAAGVGGVLRHPAPAEAADGDDREATFAGRALGRAMEMINDRRSGGRALCAAGGGITGIYYEVGALKCLADCLSPGALNSFDMYFGISAGSVVSGLLAVGYSVEELMAGVAGHGAGRVPSLNLGLLRLAHLNHKDYIDRLGFAARAVPSRIRRMVSRPRGDDLSSLMFQYGDVIGAPFHARSFERLLKELLSAAGSTNDFSRLPRPLYIGASDQDERQHVLFGSEGHRDVPISQAIQASLSVNPAFASVPINGRYYEDGQVTRTTNFAEAIQRGARLILLLDPFVPYISHEPGFAHRRGVLYNIDQNLRTISYTRFNNALNWILRKHPDVSAKTGLAEAVAARLRTVQRPTLGDFFVDGQIQIPEPPLCLHAAGERTKA